jgi:uncharacterized membrane protein
MAWSVGFRVRQYVKNSLWLVPLIGGITGLLLAELANRLDAESDLALLTYSPETATAVVSASIAAVVSLTGFVITVTVLGVQQATGIFSPRYMRLWYRDGRLKLVLAELVGTLMFSIGVIRQIQPDAVPNISVSMAGLGVSIGLLLFLLYFDRFLHRMRPVAVAALLAREGRRAFDEWMVESAHPDLAPVADRSWEASTPPTFVLRAARSGTIQALHTVGLRAVARERRCLLVFRHSVGDFVPVGAVILEVHGASVSEAVAQRLATMLAMGAERTIEHDPAFAIRVMVDIATRALSPAVNDPTTAVQVLDHLAEILRSIGVASALLPRSVPESLQSGVVMPVRTWADYLALGVSEIRAYGATSIQVTRRLRALLSELRELVPPANQVAVDDELRRLDAVVLAIWGSGVDRTRAMTPDYQGIGGPAMGRQVAGVASATSGAGTGDAQAMNRPAAARGSGQGGSDG